jgi:hypothetical protein
MSVARLTASLLAKKGGAFPIGNAYANPLLGPLPVRGEATPRRTRTSRDAGPRCRLAPELHARLRILAARQALPVRAVLEAVVADYLTANGEHCPCLRSREGAAAAGACDGPGGCCRPTGP